MDVNIKDEDGETALFVVETVEAAQILFEELKVDINVTNSEGLTAEEKIRTEGDYPTVAEYLYETRIRGFAASGVSSSQVDAEAVGSASHEVRHPPPLPPNVTVNIDTMDATLEEEQQQEVVDPEFRRRIEELASREDFQAEEGQKALRDLIKDAVREVGVDGNRDVRRRL